MKKNTAITALIIAKNEADMIEHCIATLDWCSEVIVIDDGSTDKTREISENMGANVISFKHESFAKKREAALKRATTDWIFYIDADERVTPTLAKEIQVLIETTTAVAFRVKRKNIFFGTEFHYGGTQTDYVERVFKRSQLVGWKGEIHESPEFSGESLDLKTELIHFTHRDVISGLYKTAEWTPMEATALYAANIAPVTFWTLLRKGSMEFLRRAVFQQGYKDGMPGLVEALIQAWNRIIVYIQVWELQQNPSIPEKYSQAEAEITAEWKNFS